MARDLTGSLKPLRAAIIEGDDDGALVWVERALGAGIDPADVLRGIISGIEEVGRLWVDNKVWLPEVILSAGAFVAALDKLTPLLEAGSEGRAGRVVIGAVKGDVHDLGKSIVAAMLSGAGFEVIDLGVDVPTSVFIEKVRELQPQILGIGAYMTATSLVAADIISGLRDEGLRDGVKVLVGGVPFTQQFADHVGADAWGQTAMDAVAKSKRLTGGTP